MSRFDKRLKIRAVRSILGLSAFLNRNRYRSDTPSRLLVVSTTGVGDTLWGVPALRALRESFPKAEIGVLTSPLGYQLLENSPYIDELFVFRRGASQALAFFQLLDRLRAKKYDSAFFFHASDRVVWPLVHFAGVRDFYGFKDQNKGLDFILQNLLPLSVKEHAIKARLNLVELIGAATEDTTLGITFKSHETTAFPKKLESVGFGKGRPVIGMHPGSQKLYKCWPSEKYAELGRLLSEEFSCRIIVTGDKSEVDLAKSISSKIPGSVSVAGKLNLRETAYLLGELDLLVSNDTGPMHMAFAMSTPTVALFGPTDPVFCGPYGVENARVIQAKGLCSDCIGKNCEKQMCMNSIKVEEVMESVRALFANNP